MLAAVKMCSPRAYGTDRCRHGEDDVVAYRQRSDSLR
jgi:hypothetical protein